MVRTTLLLAVIVFITGCAIQANPANTPAATYTGMRAHREVVAQCPVGQVMQCRTTGDNVGMLGMSCSCASAR